MASGLPVVAADCAPNREIAGATGTYFAPDDVSQMANAILSLVVNAPRRRALGRAARIRSSLFSWTAVFDDLFTEYESALAGRDPVRTPAPWMRRSGVFSHVR
jgi:glycosyltransferase involved in cell wall biosynthesis